MKKTVFVGTLAASALLAGMVSAQTLTEVQSRGE